MLSWNIALSCHIPHLLCSACQVVVAHRAIGCRTSAGAGANLLWRITINGLTSQSPVTSYAPPVISTLLAVAVRVGDELVPATSPLAALSTLSTQGGETVRITGLNFGPASPQSFVDGVWLVHGGSGRRNMVGCVFVMPHRALECQTPSGTGTGLRLQLSVLGQASGVSLDTVSYSPPQVSTVTPASVPTEGAFVSIEGVNFGSDLASTSVLLSTGVELRDVAFVVPHRGLRVHIPHTAIAGVRNFTLVLRAGSQVRAYTGSVVLHVYLLQHHAWLARWGCTTNWLHTLERVLGLFYALSVRALA